MKIKDLLNKIFNIENKRPNVSICNYGVSLDDLPKYEDLSNDEKRYVAELINKIDLYNLEGYLEEDNEKIDKMNYIIEYLCSKLIDTCKMFGEVSDNTDSKTVNEVGINNLIESKKLELFSKNFYEIKKKFILMIIGLNEKISMEENMVSSKNIKHKMLT